jgi:Tropinone reductase 1
MAESVEQLTAAVAVAEASLCSKRQALARATGVAGHTLQAGRWRLDGRTTLVTGGTKGIGQATVEELASLGARVFTCARDATLLSQRLAEWKAVGLDVQGIACDVASADGRELLLAAVADWCSGQLSAVFANAGTNIRKATVDYSAAEYDAILGLNTTSIYALLQRLHPLLLAQARSSPLAGASVVFNSSVAGTSSMSSGTVYAMSKAALNQLARNLSAEWGPQNIRVNSVCPWYTDTPLAAPVISDPAKLAVVLSRTPLGRVARPEEIAAVVVFLLMPGAAYITGQSIVVDGGFSNSGNYVFDQT